MNQSKQNDQMTNELGLLVTEFVTDIRRRARAVECLMSPKSPAWSFDVDQLPADDAGQLVAIKREVDRTFSAVFTDTPRARNQQLISMRGK